jgi:hypothetical protein
MIIAIIIAVLVLLGLAWYLRRRATIRKENPVFNPAGEPLPSSCRSGNHDLPDMLIGGSWESVSCWRCGMRVYDPPEPVPEKGTFAGWIAIAYWGGIYDQTSLTFHRRWPRETTYELESFSKDLVELSVKVGDYYDGKEAYRLSFGKGGITVTGSGGPATLRVPHRDLAELLAGKQQKLECAGGQAEVRGFSSARGGWQVDDAWHLTVQDADGKAVTHLPLFPTLLGRLLRPWAEAVLEDGPLEWPCVSRGGEREPVSFTRREARFTLEHRHVWSESQNDDIIATQLELREIGEGV